MKIVISYKQIPREINSDFSICGSKADLKNIAETILREIESDFSYGWVIIKDNPFKPAANTPPKDWDA